MPDNDNGLLNWQRTAPVRDNKDNLEQETKGALLLHRG